VWSQLTNCIGVYTDCVIAFLWPPCANLKSMAVDNPYPLDFLSRRPKSWQQWNRVTSMPEEITKRTSCPYWAYTYNALEDIRQSHQCQVLYFARRMKICRLVLSICWHIQSYNFNVYDTWEQFLIFVGSTFILKNRLLYFLRLWTWIHLLQVYRLVGFQVYLLFHHSSPFERVSVVRCS
jgi:hypothetical protein